MTTTVSTTRTLAVYPIAPYGSPRSEDELALYGHCAAFCTLEGPTHGQTVDEHGPWCTSIFAGQASAVDDQGRAVEAYLDLAEHYLHGVYRREDARPGAASTATASSDCHSWAMPSPTT